MPPLFYAFVKFSAKLFSDISMTPIVVAAAVEILTFQVFIVGNYQVSNVQRNLRAFVNQVFLQLNACFHAFVLILQGCNIINQLVSLRIGEVMVVGTGTGVEQVAINEVNLGVFVPAPQEQVLFAVLAGSLQRACSIGTRSTVIPICARLAWITVAICS